MLQSLTSSLPGSRMYRSGNMDIFVVTDGEVPYDKSCFAPGISRPDLDSVSKNTTNYINLTHNVLVFFRNSKIILIDAGNGKTNSGHGGHLITHLKTIGIAPDMVTDVVLTHAHPDHLGGLVGLNRQLVFPKASIHISPVGYEFWQSDTADFSKSKNTPQALRDVQKNIQQMLAVIKERLQFFDCTALLFDFYNLYRQWDILPGIVCLSYMLVMKNLCTWEIFSMKRWCCLINLSGGQFLTLILNLL